VTRRPEKGVTKTKIVLAVFLMAGMAFLGGCASTGSTTLPSDSVAFLTNDYRFKEVMHSNKDVQGWAEDALHTINELQYQLELERNK